MYNVAMYNVAMYNAAYVIAYYNQVATELDWRPPMKNSGSRHFILWQPSMYNGGENNKY